MDEIKVSKEGAKQRLAALLNEGRDLVRRIIEFRKKEGIHKISEGPLMDEYLNWEHRAESALEKVFVSFIYSREFEKKTGPGTQYVSSGWEPDLEYYIGRQLIPKLEYLEVLFKNIDKYEVKIPQPESEKQAAVRGIIKLVNIMEVKLRKLIRELPTKEKEIQDSIENLLIGADVTYSREKEKIEYSSKTYVPDFTIPDLDVAIEAKFCDKPNREKEMISEINDDILAYKTKHQNLFFLIYDVGQIRDKELFTSSFEKHENVIVRIIKH